MEMYSPIDQVATKLGTTVESVLEFEQHGLVGTVKKNGILFLSGREAYKLSFILFLQRERHLGMPEIIRVLRTQQPPYNADAIEVAPGAQAECRARSR